MFIKEEYQIEVGCQKFYIDLLFYHRILQCLVAFELKIGEFRPEYISKMSFYLEALNRSERHKNENPSVSVILCASKNDEIVEYVLSQALSKAMVAVYELNLIDKKLLAQKLKECIMIANLNCDNKK